MKCEKCKEEMNGPISPLAEYTSEGGNSPILNNKNYQYECRNPDCDKHGQAIEVP